MYTELGLVKINSWVATSQAMTKFRMHQYDALLVVVPLYPSRLEELSETSLVKELPREASQEDPNKRTIDIIHNR